jgi:hypothetical protein
MPTGRPLFCRRAGDLPVARPGARGVHGGDRREARRPVHDPEPRTRAVKRHPEVIGENQSGSSVERPLTVSVAEAGAEMPRSERLAPASIAAAVEMGRKPRSAPVPSAPTLKPPCGLWRVGPASALVRVGPASALVVVRHGPDWARGSAADAARTSAPAVGPWSLGRFATRSRPW